MKVGDKVTVKAGNSYDNGDCDILPITKPGQVAYITDLLDYGAQLALHPACDPDEHSGNSLFFNFSEFEVVKEEGFKVGDRVRLSMQGIRKWRRPDLEIHDEVNSNPIFTDGTVFEVIEKGSFSHDNGFRFRVVWDNGTQNSYMEGDIENA